METRVAGGTIPARKAGPPILWGVAAQPKRPGQASGDGYLLRWIGGHLLCAVVDGAGSGREAAEATDRCLAALQEADSPDLRALFRLSHRALVQSRGAAVGLITIEPETGTMTWAAIGDIDAVMMHTDPGGALRRETILRRGGTLGVSLARPLVQSHGLSPGDTVIMTTDGILRGFHERVRPGPIPPQVARNIMADFGTGSDDSLVLVIRFGSGP